jgi:hypothetical protein
MAAINATGQYITTEKVDESLQEIRRSGEFNMFDFSGVEARAWADGHTELADFMLDVGREGWGRVIIYGLDTSADKR